MRRAGPRSHEAGLTLIELLVSLALTAAIASFILGGFHLARRTLAITHDRQAAEEIDAAATSLRGLLASAMPMATIDGADRTARLLFEGRSDDLVFVTLSEATAFEGGPMRAHLSWQDGPPRPGRSAALVLRTAVFRQNPRLLFESRPVILFRNVTGFSLRYFGAPGPASSPPQWHAEWLDHDRLPLAVLVRIDLAAGNHTRRVAIQVALRLAPAE